MGSLDNDINQYFQDAIDVIQQHSNILYYDTDNKYYETLGSQQSVSRHGFSYHQLSPLSEAPRPTYDWSEVQSWPHIVPEVSVDPITPTEPPQFYPILPQRHGKGRKKLRLYEYLHEALNDTTMVDSIQWTDRGTGTFHFISKNKEKLAESWGQRKGNRKTMTYQKMARALRNYSRTGEIVKVRRKLTYQFNPAILQRLAAAVPAYAAHRATHEMPVHHQPHAEQGYYCTSLSDWYSWHSQCYQGEYDLATVFTSNDGPKACVPSQRQQTETQSNTASGLPTGVSVQ